MRLLITLLCLFGLMAAGCDSYSTMPYREHAGYGQRMATVEQEASLFGDDAAVLSATAIETIFNSSVVIPAEARMAVLHFGSRNGWSLWSSELSELDNQTTITFLNALQESPRLREVSNLPGLLTPIQGTIPYFREAAARLQADLLLIYRASNNTYDKPRILRPDLIKTQCHVEAVLLDIRTGLVPFTSIATQKHEAEKTADDYNIAETTAKANMQARQKALKEIAQDLIAFLNAFPQPDTVAEAH